VSCIVGPFDDVVKPFVSEQLDYEAELAVFIGRNCRHVTVEDARSVIEGYMVANDASARDWQFRMPTATLGKSFDTHGPTGPWLVLADEVEDPLRSRCGCSSMARSASTAIHATWSIISLSKSHICPP
jgi:2-keto-4-pentenoate hydratase/2-oxohepta-3-ene-1,7-dioic acid hydratase in catechol pathway